MIAYRPAMSHDRKFIIDSWVSSYRTAQAAGLIAMEDWFSVMIPQVAKILDRPSTTTIVASDPDEHDRIADVHGFIAADLSDGPPLVFYVLVKEAYRRAGIARGLFRAVGINPEHPFLYACKTPVVTDFVRQQKIPRARWDQLAARFPHKVDPRRNR